MLTFGHGTLDRAGLAALVTGAGIERIVDVRRFPGSRANPAAAAGQVEDLARELGIDYRHDERLGGRRRLSAADDAASPDGWWRVAQFRAYAAWTRTPEFRAGLVDLLADDAASRTAIMCSESVWWRCHRRLVADVVTVEHARSVEHLMPDGSLRAHPVSEGARQRPDGMLEWPQSHPVHSRLDM